MQLSLLDGKSKDQIAIERLQTFCPEEGYYLAFSGGKDSITLYDLAKRSGVKFDAHYHLTTVDPPELVQFIKHQHPEVHIIRPRMSMWQLIEEHKCLPTRFMRYCCSELKEIGGHKRIVATGLRWAESNRRANRKLLEKAKRDPSKSLFNPIIDWTDKDVWQYIREQNLKYCSLYDEGWTRLGCILCPMIDKEPLRREIVKYPKIVSAWRSAAHKAWANRERTDVWATADEYFEWWLSRKPLVQETPQTSFEDCLTPFSDV